MRRWLLVIAGVASVCLLTRAPLVLRADPATTSRLQWVTNGTVTAGAVAGNTLYIGGAFTRVAPASGMLGSFVAFQPSTGAVTPGLPRVDGEVTAIAPDGAGGYYIGGSFTRVDNVARTGLAHVRADGSVDAGFAPALRPTDNRPTVTSLAVLGNAVFLTGRFDTVNQSPRPGVAALSTADGALLPWVPAPGLSEFVRLLTWNGQLVGMATRTSSAVVLVLDQTTGAVVRESVVGQSPWPTTAAQVIGPSLVVTAFTTRFGLARVDLTSGAVDSTWMSLAVTGGLNSIDAFAVSGSTLYLAGFFTGVGGLPRTHLAALNMTTNAVTSWAPSVNAPVTALLATPAGVIAGGYFTEANGVPREGLAEFDVLGSTTAWSTPVTSSAVRVLTRDGPDRVLFGGRLAITGGIPRSNLAAFDLASNSLQPWAPVVRGSISTLSHAGSRVFVGSDWIEPETQQHSIEIAALDDATGVPVSWQPPPAPPYIPGFNVLGSDNRWLYVRGLFSPGPDVRRLSVDTGAADPGWSAPAPALLVHDDIYYFLRVGGTVGAKHTATGEVARWRPTLVEPRQEVTLQPTMAIDGSTAFFSYASRGAFGEAGPGVTAVDLRSGLRVTPSGVGAASIVTADGQLISRGGLPLLQATDATGASLPWAPTVADVPSARSQPPIFVTPTDVVVLGVTSVWPTPINGVAIFARRPPVAPHGLTWLATGNQLRLTWTPPAIAPPAYTLEAGSAPGLSDLARLPLGQVTSFTANAPSGTFYVRVRPEGVSGAAMTPTNEVAVVVGCTAPPDPPSQLIASVSGANVSLHWNAPRFDRPTGYVLEAGSASGLVNVARMALGADDTSFTATAPPGTYFTRVRAANACGMSAPTAEVFVTVGSGAQMPEAPGQPTATVSGQNVAIQWPAVAGASGYVFEAGSAPTRADVRRLTVTGTTVAADGVAFGDYFVRVRAVGAEGLGPPSPELLVRVGGIPLP